MFSFLALYLAQKVVLDDPSGLGPTIAEKFFTTLLTSPYLLVTLPFILVSSLFFHRRFSTVLNCIVFLIFAFIIKINAQYPDLIEGHLFISFFPKKWVSPLLYITFLCIFSFISSTLIGKNFDPTNRMQEMMQRLNFGKRIGIFLGTYILGVGVLYLGTGILDVFFPKNHDFYIDLLFIGGFEIATLILYFYLIYKKTERLPPQEVIYKNSDYIFLVFLLILFVILLNFGSQLQWYRVTY